MDTTETQYAGSTADEEAPTAWEPAEDGDGGGDANPTLDFFLSAVPDRKVWANREIRRIGVIFHLESLGDEDFERSMKRSEKKQTKMEKQRGVPVQRDGSKMEKLILVDSCKWIARRVMTDDEAKERNVTRTFMVGGDEQEVLWPYGPELPITDQQLLAKWGPRPEDFLTNWLLPGERTQLADLVADISGYDAEALRDPVSTAKN